jgi:hypothetical protein
MSKILYRIVLCIVVVGAVSAAGFAQGRGKGKGWDKKSAVFDDRDYRGNRWRSQNWKCGKFVNCHDARDGRVDGRGPSRTTGYRHNGDFYPRGSSVGYRHRYTTRDYWQRHRYSTSDYWQRRHLTYGTRYNPR